MEKQTTTQPPYLIAAKNIQCKERAKIKTEAEKRQAEFRAANHQAEQKNILDIVAELEAGFKE